MTVFCCREVGTGLKKIEFRPNAIGSFRTDISHLALLHLSLILVGGVGGWGGGGGWGVGGKTGVFQPVFQDLCSTGKNYYK